MSTEHTPRRAIVLHGYGATPEDHWFGWLAAGLAEAGFATSVPRLPDSDAPAAARWQEALRAAVGVPGPGTVIVAHSLGTVTTLRYLASLEGDWRLDTLVLVAGFLDPLPGLPDLDSFIAESAVADGVFAGESGLGSHIGRVWVIRSDADTYVPAGHTDRLAGLLGTESLVVAGAGHFLAEEGITTLPPALDAALGRPFAPEAHRRV